MKLQSFVVREEIKVSAPIERCFALSTNLALVAEILQMRPIGGRLAGFVNGGDTVLWQGWKWGLPHTHESLIEAFTPPAFFRDRMISGRFAAFEHDHNFIPQKDGSVLLNDELRFQLPWGAAGTLFGRILVLPHIHRLMCKRFALIKRLAEGDAWKPYLQ